MIEALIILVVIVGACVFAAYCTAPHCEPTDLRAANLAEREALAGGCRRCSAESDREECRECGERIAAWLKTEGGR